MAWRIQDSVLRGEIDNRLPGMVRGQLWLAGVTLPVTLELTGNACADLAGCLIAFHTTQPRVPLRTDAVFAPVQRGRVGDITASRKVRVFDLPVHEALAMINRGAKPPEHLANCLYLEWFSETNGRVVVESVDFTFAISPPQWRLSAAAERQRQADTRVAWQDFLGRLDDAIAHQQRGAKDPETPWDEHDYERFLKESDARTDKFGELLDKYGDSEEAQEKIAEEMGWTRELTDEEAGDEDHWVEELNAACADALDEPPPEPDPLREGIDWVRTADGDIEHPLQHRCRESAIRFWRIADEFGLEKAGDDDLAQFVFEFQTAAAKLAGALHGIARGASHAEPAFTVASLKRALDHLHQAQAGLESVAKKGSPLPEPLVAEARTELFEIREGILRLMQELRQQ